MKSMKMHCLMLSTRTVIYDPVCQKTNLWILVHLRFLCLLNSAMCWVMEWILSTDTKME